MPKPLPEYLVYFLEDCLGGDPAYSYKSMFGGYSIYKNGKIFAVYLDSELYFKVDDNNRADYIEKGCQCFSYEKKSGQVAVMAYYTVAESILEDREELEKWIEKSLSISEKTKKKKSEKNIALDKAILEFLLTIPKGKVSSYKYLADKFGVHPRRIASVMKHNKQPLKYPCYKILADSGKISGYNTDGGVSEKQEKLEFDGIKIVEGKVDKKYFIS